MDHFTRKNARTAALLNLAINVMAPALLFRQHEAFNVSGAAPTLVDLLLPAVIISAFATTLATFATMTRQRIARTLLPGLAPETRWVGVALLTGIVLALGMAGVAFGLIRVVQVAASGAVLSKGVALAVSGGVGALVALFTAHLAVQRARLIQ